MVSFDSDYSGGDGASPLFLRSVILPSPRRCRWGDLERAWWALANDRGS